MEAIYVINPSQNLRYSSEFPKNLASLLKNFKDFWYFLTLIPSFSALLALNSNYISAQQAKLPHTHINVLSLIFDVFI
jgi:hypothetical protein